MAYAYQLPAHIDQSKVAASYKNGVLTLTLPKSQEAKARKIKISA
jgi:HSP20 family protein